ncbi:MAG: hypothetical protein CMD19_03240, partial [Flavobacteriales bacterium]|nr:hypothetical protein [Flavobacteriales bacterium]
MKKILLTTICFVLVTCIFSQQHTSYAVSSGGTYSIGGGHSNSSTIGESMVTTLISASNVVTQGFQQSFPGCTDSTACNYDSAANTDDGSCIYAATGYDCAGNCLVGSNILLVLTDTYGDGWNANSLTINGV